MRKILVLGFCLAVLPISILIAQTKLTLTAEQVKELSLRNSVSIQLASIDKQIGEQDLPEAKSIYDTVLSANASYMEDKSQRTITIFGTETNQTDFDIALSQKTPLGTELQVGYANTRESSDSIFATFNPSYESTVETSLRQPVSNNAFGFLNRKQIQMVKKQVKALDHQTQARIEAGVYTTLMHYWEFYTYTHLARFEGEALEKARELYHTNREKADIGLIEKPDLHAFAANYDIRESQWLDAKNSLARTTEQIRSDLDIDPMLEIKSGEESFGWKETPPSTEEALKDAFELRPDYLALKKEIEAANLQVAMNKNSLWPQIDVLASLDLNGIDREYGQAVENIGDGNPLWAVGMEFSFPLQNRAARSSYKRNKLQRTKKILELKNKELEITRQVMEKGKQFKNTERQMAAGIRARNNQYQKMIGELKKYEQGRSDSDTVIRFQNDYIDAKKMALQAQVNYAIAILDLKYVQGKLSRL